ncbi:MAG: hypothetical protein HY862_03090 [Chloroflexi bacterium]|nr:hypothetical protein [Chloroflexota bacterium]
MLEQKRRLLFALAFVLCLTSLAFGPPRQNNDLQLDIKAGFQSYYRDGEWIPLEVTLINNGRDLRGNVQVHAQNAGQATETLYQTPITVARNSSKTIFFYVSLSDRASEIEVEIADNNGRILKVQSEQIKQLAARDVLYGVVTESPIGAVDMTNQPVGRGSSYQATLTLDDIPFDADALRALDVLLFFDVDTGTLSAEQRDAIKNWVVGGGHLIIHGGPNWQRTTAGLMDVMPTQPNGTRNFETLTALGDYLSHPSDALNKPTIVTANTPKENAKVLLSIEDTPIIVRQTLGAGAVDFVALDPQTEPLRSYTDTDVIWYSLLVNGPVRPSWSYGFADWDIANDASRIITGFDLPSVFQLIGFLILYIALIGPINYYLLRWIGRRELAWFTIPALIIVFTLLAYFTGFSLRGNSATVSHLAIVQVFPDSDTARVDGLVGVFSPRRTSYNLEAPTGITLRTLPGYHDSNLGIEQIKLVESNAYRVEDLPVDAGIITSFTTSGYIPAQHIESEAIWQIGNSQDAHLTGNVTNSLAFDFEDTVILAKDAFFPLGDLLAGETRSFDFSVNFEGPTWLPLGNSTDYNAPFSYYGYSGFSSYSSYGCTNRPLNTTATQIMTDKQYDCFGSTTDDNERRLRRRALLASAINNEIDLSGGRAGSVYLVGWANQPAFQIAVEGTEQTNKYETLYIFKLNSRYEAANQSAVIIPPGLQTWTVADQDNPATRLDNSPYQVDLLNPNEQAVFRFAPLNDLPLTAISQLDFYTSLQTSESEVEFALWDWQAQEWSVIENLENLSGTPTGGTSYQSRLAGQAVHRFIGPDFAVQVRVRMPNGGSTQTSGYSGNIEAVEITLHGQFKN